MNTTNLYAMVHLMAPDKESMPLKNSATECATTLCKLAKLDFFAIASASRCREIVIARYVIGYIMIKKSYTLREVGQALGGRDHSTIVYLRNKVQDLIEVKDDALMACVSRLPIFLQSFFAC